METEAGTVETETVPLNQELEKLKLQNKILYVTVAVLLIILIIIIIIAAATDAFNPCTCEETTTSTTSTTNCQYPNFANESDMVIIEDGNQYDFNTSVCEGYRELWEDPSIPLSERNVIGRAIYQTPYKVQQAISLINIGKRYDLGRTYSEDIPFAFGRYFETQLYCGEAGRYGFCTQGINTNAMGNIGTQFDYFGHFYMIDEDKEDEDDYPSNKYAVLFNNFRGDQILGPDSNFSIYTGEGIKTGANYIGTDKLPMFFTRAWLIDIAGYKGKTTLDEYYGITADDFRNAMIAQDLDINDISQGDVILIYTGWDYIYDSDPVLFYDFFRTPGILPEIITDILYHKGVMIMGSDNWTVDQWRFNVTLNDTSLVGVHEILVACGGGFNHEGLYLQEWVNDARNGDVPWMGAYLYQTLPIKGSVASPGKPVVFV